MKTDATKILNQQSRQSRAVPARSGPARPGSVRAFTLIELMISIALVLLLILGVNQVFTYTTQAVGAGEAVNSAIRLSRAAQAQFASDFAQIVPNGTGPNDSASIIISSRALYAFSSAKDQAAQGTTASNNSTGLPVQAFLDLAGTGNFGDPNVNGDTVFPSTYNLRNHRLDTLSFFARGLFQRQTGNPGVFVDNLSSQEAWIWYGHLHLPDNRGLGPNGTPDQLQDYPHDPNNPGANDPLDTFPCQGNSSTNPNNYFGGKLVLGRVAMVLQPKNFGVVLDTQNNTQWFIDQDGFNDLTPLETGAGINASGGTGPDPTWPSGVYYLPDSRVDVAATSISIFRQRLANVIKFSPATAWYDLMMDGNQAAPAVSSFYPRFKSNPFVSKPMSSRDMAQASPYFIGGCSQFIVEFAGDFITQDNNPAHTPPGNLGTRTNYGDVNSLASDGQIDFTATYPNGTNNPPVKVIKWYGMPRSTSGFTTINGSNGDVVPVRDWLQNMKNPDGTAATPSSLTNAPFERYFPAYQNYQTGDYKLNMSVSDAQKGYTCAFGPGDPHPKLIRITITLDDPTGRLPDGQTYQYVFALP